MPELGSGSRSSHTAVRALAIGAWRICSSSGHIGCIERVIPWFTFGAIIKSPSRTKLNSQDSSRDHLFATQASLRRKRGTNLLFSSDSDDRHGATSLLRAVDIVDCLYSPMLGYRSCP